MLHMYHQIKVLDWLAGSPFLISWLTNSIHELMCRRRSLECAMSIVVVCTNSPHDHGRAECLHLAFLFACMSEDYASWNQRMINAAAWVELKYQSLTREEERETSLQRVTEHELWVQTRVVFFQNMFHGVYYAKQSVLKTHHDRFHRLLMCFGDVQLAADPGANPSHAAGITSPIWHWNISVSSQKSWGKKLDAPCFPAETAAPSDPELEGDKDERRETFHMLPLFLYCSY